MGVVAVSVQFHEIETWIFAKFVWIAQNFGMADDTEAEALATFWAIAGHDDTSSEDGQGAGSGPGQAGSDGKQGMEVAADPESKLCESSATLTGSAATTTLETYTRGASSAAAEDSEKNSRIRAYKLLFDMPVVLFLFSAFQVTMAPVLATAVDFKEGDGDKGVLDKAARRKTTLQQQYVVVEFLYYQYHHRLWLTFARIIAHSGRSGAAVSMRAFKTSQRMLTRSAVGSEL